MKRNIILSAICILSTLCCKAQDASPVSITEVMVANIDCFLSPAGNFDGWAEFYNSSVDDYPLAGCYLSDDAADPAKWKCPDTMPAIPARGWLVVWFDSNGIAATQPPFKLDAKGGTVILSDREQRKVVSLDYPKSVQRASWAMMDGEWSYTSQPTPGEANTSEGRSMKQLAMPQVSKPSMLFSGESSFSVSGPEGATVRYTTDGSVPTMENGSVLADGDITISATTNFRFRAFQDGLLPCNVMTRSFIRDTVGLTLPVVSVVTDSAFLFGREAGVMSDSLQANGTPNYAMDWERPVSFSYIMADSSLEAKDVFLEVSGSESRKYPQKSFKLKGNKLLGSKKYDYPFFAEKPFNKNRTLLLRNGGNDYLYKITDPSLEVMLQRSGIDIESQCYEPVQYYINGKYMGVINMREPSNKHYVYANYGWDDDEIDFYEIDGSHFILKYGTTSAFNQLHDLSAHAEVAEAYAAIRDLLDVEEYINFTAAELYLGIHDGWPIHNTKMFRRSDGGRLRYISFDLDLAFRNTRSIADLFDTSRYGSAMMKKSVQTFLNLLRNPSFRRRFLDTFSIMGGSVFSNRHADGIIDSLTARVKAPMALQGVNMDAKARAMKRQLSEQNDIARKNLIDSHLFGVTAEDEASVSVTADIPGATLCLNDTKIPYGDFDGKVFLPARLAAIAPTTHVFEGWKRADGTLFSTEPTIDVPAEGISLTASFSLITAVDAALATSGEVQISVRDGRLTVVSPKDIATLNVYVMSGSLIATYSGGHRNYCEAEIPHLPKGIYLITVTTVDGTVHSRRIPICAGDYHNLKTTGF